MQKKEANTPEQGERTSDKRMYAPLFVDILEKEQDIIVVADMPGVDENTVDITLEKNVLTIYGSMNFVSVNLISQCKDPLIVSDILPKAETVEIRKLQVKAEGEGGVIDVNK